MYTITGVTGQVGGAVARALLAAGKPVRAVVRDSAKGEAWAKKGCDIALADVDNIDAMTAAFKDAAGVFIMMPSNFDPSLGFPEARQIAVGLRNALAAAKPAKVVCLSTIGAQVTQPNLLNQLQILEQELSTLEMPVTFLRPGWFMENCQWDVEAAKTGVIPSFLQPLDQPFPMIATADVGQTAAELLQEQWQGKRIVELVGSEYVSPNQIAATFSELLGQPVKMAVVARDTWHDLFVAQGMNNPVPRVQMIDGFNEGWIKFAGEPRKGKVSLRTVLEGLLTR